MYKPSFSEECTGHLHNGSIHLTEPAGRSRMAKPSLYSASWRTLSLSPTPIESTITVRSEYPRSVPTGGHLPPSNKSAASPTAQGWVPGTYFLFLRRRSEYSDVPFRFESISYSSTSENKDEDKRDSNAGNVTRRNERRSSKCVRKLRLPSAERNTMRSASDSFRAWSTSLENTKNARRGKVGVIEGNRSGKLSMKARKATTALSSDFKADASSKDPGA